MEPREPAPSDAAPPDGRDDGARPNGVHDAPPHGRGDDAAPDGHDGPVWAHDEYLDRVSVPYRIEAGLRDSHRGVLFRSRSYRVVADVRSRSAARTPRTRLLARVDATNVLELYVGHGGVHEDGALVVVDRVLHFGVLEVWPVRGPPWSDRGARRCKSAKAGSARVEVPRRCRH